MKVSVFFIEILENEMDNSEQSLGDDSSCGHMFAFLESDTPPAADFFEGTIALNGEDRKYKKQLSAF